MRSNQLQGYDGEERERQEQCRRSDKAVCILSNQRKGFQESMPNIMEVGASEVEELEKTVVFGYGEVIYDFSFYQDAKLVQLLVPASKNNLQEMEW